MKKKFFSAREILFLILCLIVPIILFSFSSKIYNLLSKYLSLFGSNKIGFELVGQYYFFLFLVLVIILIKQSLVLIYNYFVLRNAKKGESEDHDTAIIIANQETFSIKNLILSSYSYSFKHFFKLMKIKGVKYKIFEDLTIEKFDNLIKEHGIKNYYLFGHGSKHAFSLYEEVPIYYCKYADIGLDKDFVAQYHCNHGKGKSLADYIVRNEEKRRKCDITDDERKPQELKKQWKKEIKTIKRDNRQ
jgi:hypothetical protein